MTTTRRKTKTKKKKAKARAGKMRTVPKAVAGSVTLALSHVRLAKKRLEKLAPKSRKAWAELHNVESRLTRLSR